MIVRTKFTRTRMLIFESQAFYIPLLNRWKQIGNKQLDDYFNILRITQSRKCCWRIFSEIGRNQPFQSRTKDFTTEMNKYPNLRIMLDFFEDTVSKLCEQYTRAWTGSFWQRPGAEHRGYASTDLRVSGCEVGGAGGRLIPRARSDGANFCLKFWKRSSGWWLWGMQQRIVEQFVVCSFHRLCEQYTYKYSTYEIAQHDHISSSEHAWLKVKIAHLCVLITIVIQNGGSTQVPYLTRDPVPCLKFLPPAV